MKAWLRHVLHIKTADEAIADAGEEPVVKNALRGLKRVDRLTGSKFADRILVELQAIEGKNK